MTTRLDNGVVATVWFEFEETEPHRIRRTSTIEHDPAADTPPAFDEASTVTVRDDGELAANIPSAYTTTVGAFGGYVAALAVRAAGASGSKPLPLSLSGQFVNAGRSGDVGARVSVLRSSSRLESSSVQLVQAEQLLFAGHAWSGVPAAPSLTHARLPAWLRDAAPPSGDARTESGGPLGGAMSAEWVPMPAGAEVHDGMSHAAWIQLQPRSAFSGDPWADAARLLLPIDWLGVVAGVHPHRAVPGMVVASTLDLAVTFYDHEHASDWLLCTAGCSRSGGGRATTDVTVRSEGGAVLAVASLHLLLRGSAT